MGKRMLKLFSKHKAKAKPFIRPFSRRVVGKAVKTGSQFGSPDIKNADTDKILKEAGLTRSDLAALLYDDEIATCANIRTQAVLGNDWHIEGDTTDWLWAAIDNLLNSAVTHIMQAVWLGSSIAELIWVKTDTGMTIERLEPRKMERFKRSNKGLVFTDDYGAEILVVPEKVLNVGVNVNEDNPFGDALLSRVYWAWFNKNYGEQFWSKFAERHASPLTVGKFDINTVNELEAQDQLTEHAIALAGAVAAGVITLTKEDEIEFAETSNNGEAHQLFVTHQIKRIQKAFLGRVLTSELSSGSRAAQETDQALTDGILQADLTLCEDGINQIIAHLLNVNGVNPEGVYFVFDREQSIDKTRWERDVALINTGKIEFTEQYYLDNYGLEKDQFILIAKSEGLSLSLSKQSLSPKLTKGAQEVEDSLIEALKNAPADDENIAELVQLASSEADLIRRLALYYDDVENGDYETWLATALATAEAQGFYHAQKGKF